MHSVWCSISGDISVHAWKTYPPSGPSQYYHFGTQALSPARPSAQSGLSFVKRKPDKARGLSPNRAWHITNIAALGPVICPMCFCSKPFEIYITNPIKSEAQMTAKFGRNKGNPFFICGKGTYSCLRGMDKISFFRLRLWHL